MSPYPDSDNDGLNALIDARVQALLRDSTLREQVAPRSFPVNKLNPGKVTGTVIVNNNGIAEWGYAGVPIGGIIDYYGTTEPTGWLFPTGQAIPAQYTTGIAVIGANTPDLRGRVAVALDNMGGTDAGRLSVANTLGGSGGEESHLLLTGEAAQKAVTAGASAVSGTIIQYLGPTLTTYLPTAGSGIGGTVNTSGVSSFSLTAAGQSIAGSSAVTAHNNMQPYVLVNKLIRVG